MLLLLALIGHCFLWTALVNLTHSTAWNHRLVQGLSNLCFAAMGLIPVGLAAGFWAADWGFRDAVAWGHCPLPVRLYLIGCWIAAVAGGVDWLRRRVLRRPPAALRRERSAVVSVISSAEKPGESAANRRLGLFLGREAHELEIAEKDLELPGLPAALDGLSILHLSDLHFTGKIERRYFEEVVRLGSALEPDLVAITGDIIDASECIAWVPETLGRLSARHGVYFILGNHDMRHDWRRLRRTMTDCGLIDLGGRWLETAVRGQRIVLAGNELPWFPPAADLETAPPPSRDGGPPRILLAHGPDQIAWARARQIDLMLAGHNHGGQIQLPLYGPVFSPSRSGVRYACGTFQEPPTVLHVSRGISAKMPLRWNCRPEMIQLTLRAPAEALRAAVPSAILAVR